jgi:hypothetical protein
MAHRDGPMVKPQYFVSQERGGDLEAIPVCPRTTTSSGHPQSPRSFLTVGLLTRSGHESVAHVPTRALPRLNGLWTLTSTLGTVFREKRLEGQFLAFL